MSQAKELEDRLGANIVFVLKPPTLKSAPARVPGGDKLKERYYYSAADGISQSRGSLITTTEKLESERVTEIKTHAKFQWDQVLHVLVPEHLFELAQSVYNDRLGETD